MMDTQIAPETSVIFNQPTWLIALQDFINFSHRESFRSYTLHNFYFHLFEALRYHSYLNTLIGSLVFMTYLLFADAGGYHMRKIALNMLRKLQAVGSGL
jgi:hypothetical protein